MAEALDISRYFLVFERRGLGAHFFCVFFLFRDRMYYSSLAVVLSVVCLSDPAGTPTSVVCVCERESARDDEGLLKRLAFVVVWGKTKPRRWKETTLRF